MKIYKKKMKTYRKYYIEILMYRSKDFDKSSMQISGDLKLTKYDLLWSQATAKN